MSASPQTLFFGEELFELLVRRIPPEVLQSLPLANFEEAIGTSRERFEFITHALGASGNTQGFIGQETAGYLRNALGATLLALDASAFQKQTGIERDDALELIRQLDRFTGTAVAAGVQQ